MLTRRGFVAGSTAALLGGTLPIRCARAPRTPKPRVRVIDVHAHWYPPEWVALLEREGDANGAKMGRNQRGNVTITIPGLTVSFQPQYIDIDSRLQAMDKAGVAMHALSLTQPMAFWAPPAFGLRLCQTYNDACAAIHQKHPERFVGLAMLPMQDQALAVQEFDRVAKLPAHPRHLHGDPHQRPEPRRQGVLADLRALRGARPADPAPPGQSGRRRAHARLPSAQLHRQSDRERDRGRVVDLQRRARRLPEARCRAAARGRRRCRS